MDGLQNHVENLPHLGLDCWLALRAPAVRRAVTIGAARHPVALHGSVPLCVDCRRGCCVGTAVGARCAALRSITAAQAAADLCRSPNINIARDPRWGMLRHCLTQCQHASDATMQHTAYNAAPGGMPLTHLRSGRTRAHRLMLRRCRQARGCRVLSIRESRCYSGHYSAMGAQLRCGFVQCACLHAVEERYSLWSLPAAPRTPSLRGRAGRTLETPGEDPFLNGEYGASHTQGLQA